MYVHIHKEYKHLYVCIVYTVIIFCGRTFCICKSCVYMVTQPAWGLQSDVGVRCSDIIWNRLYIFSCYCKCCDAWEHDADITIFAALVSIRLSVIVTKTELQLIVVHLDSLAVHLLRRKCYNHTNTLKIVGKLRGFPMAILWVEDWFHPSNFPGWLALNTRTAQIKRASVPDLLLTFAMSSRLHTV